MALLGVILLLAGIGAGIYAYVGTHALTTTTTVSAFGFAREVTPFELVALGVIAMLLFAVGWALLSASARRRARARRLEREGSRVEQVEERAETERLEHERRFEEAGLRDEDLRRREAELAARHEGLNQREAELVQREGALRSADQRDGTLASADQRGGTLASADRRDGTLASADQREVGDERAQRDVGPAPGTGEVSDADAARGDDVTRPHDAPHQTV